MCNYWAHYFSVTVSFSFIDEEEISCSSGHGKSSVIRKKKKLINCNQLMMIRYICMLHNYNYALCIIGTVEAKILIIKKEPSHD